MPVDRRRKGDIKVLAGATVGVLLVGFFIAGAILVTTSGGKVVQCGQLNIGLAAGVRSNLDHGPYFQTGGGDCGFWLALENGDIVAYKAIQPSGCTLKLKFDHWECGGEEIEVERLAKYPVSIQTVRGVDAVFVNLGTLPPVSTSTTITVPTRPRVTTSDGKPLQCGTLNAGLAASVRKNLEQGPYFQTGGGDCGFWLALENGDIVAYKTKQISGCTLEPTPDQWKCDGTEIAVERLAKYPVRIRAVSGAEAVFVNLRPAASTSPTGSAPTTSSDAS